MHRDVDLLILGGGCAGLSLGTQLAELHENCPRTLILERRTQYTHDRTWCFWKDETAASHPEVQHSWGQMNLRHDGQTLKVSCGQTPYQMLPSGSFYNMARHTIQTSKRVELELGVSVNDAPKKVNGLWQMETNAGMVQAKRIIDTRPPFAPYAGGAILWQSFMGMEVETLEDLFNPEEVELMDFAQGNPSCVAFTYVLPTSTRRALVEVTRFSVHPYSAQALEETLLSELFRYTNGAEYTVLHREHGILPMGLRQKPNMQDPSYSHVGLYAGAARPSTGYAFQRIQRWAKACAMQIWSGAAPCGHAPDPLLRRAMDHLFLNVIRTHSAAAPALFMALFSCVEPERLIRFLSDRATLRDYFAIIRALPAGMFLREIPQALRSRFSSNHKELPA